jgi:hypothetical protein
MTLKHEISNNTGFDSAEVIEHIVDVLDIKYYKILNVTEKRVKFECIYRERYNFKLFDEGVFTIYQLDTQQTVTFEYVAIESFELGIIGLTLILASALAYNENIYTVFFMPFVLLLQAAYRFLTLKQFAKVLLNRITQTVA